MLLFLLSFRLLINSSMFILLTRCVARCVGCVCVCVSADLVSDITVARQGFAGMGSAHAMACTWVRCVCIALSLSVLPIRVQMPDALASLRIFSHYLFVCFFVYKVFAGCRYLIALLDTDNGEPLSSIHNVGITMVTGRQSYLRHCDPAQQIPLVAYSRHRAVCLYAAFFTISLLYNST